MRKFCVVISIIILSLSIFLRNGETQVQKKSMEKIQTLKFGVFSKGFYGLAPLYAAIEKKYMEEEAIEVEFVQLLTPQLIQAIATVQVEVGVGSLPNPIYAIANGVPIKFIAAANIIPPNRPYENILVRKGSGIHKIEDLRGKKIAVGSRRSWPGIMMAYYLKKHNVSLADVSFVEGIPLPQQKQAFEMGQIDAAYSGEPFVTMMVKSNVAEFLPIQDPWFGVNNFICVSDSYLKRNPEVIKRFLKAYVKGIRYVLDNERDSRKIIAKYAGLSEDITMSMKFGRWTSVWNRNGNIDIEGLKQFQKMMKELGFLEKEIEVNKNVDESFLPR